MTNIIFGKSFLALPSLAALVVLGSGVAVNAQTEQPETIVTPTSEELVSTIATDEIAKLTPVPGTVETSSAMLNSTANTANEKSEPSNRVAQSDIEIGGTTRGGGSYIGVGANIGITGNSSALGDANFTVISKVAFTRSLSIRPSVIIGDDTTILAPITYDFTLQSGDPFAEPLAIAPYVGVGAAIKTGDKSETALLVTGGIDVPLNNRFTATASVNAGFFDQTDVGVILGVGYNFSGF
ncbi:MAG: hypothetical protein ACKO3K_08115 [Cuspidothrix sp.]